MPVLSGPHLFNFQEIADLMLEAGALQICPGALDLENAIVKLLDKPAYRQEWGERAYGVVEQNRGSLQRLLDVIDRVAKRSGRQAR
jgi:3-deoxy-D-manno-octulosonic-acid transferase